MYILLLIGPSILTLINRWSIPLKSEAILYWFIKILFDIFNIDKLLIIYISKTTVEIIYIIV